MSGGYLGRRSINVSVFLQDLNTLPSADEQVDAFDPSDLDIWTNTQFFDFDMGVAAHDPTKAAQEQKPLAVEPAPAPAAPIDPTLKDGGEFDNFLNGACLRVCLSGRSVAPRLSIVDGKHG